MVTAATAWITKPSAPLANLSRRRSLPERDALLKGEQVVRIPGSFDLYEPGEVLALR
jgi:hypothetical protein